LYITSQLLDKKKCPFCAEEVKKEAIKCCCCGEFLINAPLLAAEKPEFVEKLLSQINDKQ